MIEHKQSRKEERRLEKKLNVKQKFDVLYANTKK
jgi:hypothetical protein